MFATNVCLKQYYKSKYQIIDETLSIERVRKQRVRVYIWLPRSISWYKHMIEKAKCTLLRRALSSLFIDLNKSQ